jgi:hypothetical protein
VSVSRQTSTTARVHWTANAEPDFASYTVYRATSASGPFSPIASGVLTNQYDDANVTADDPFWYQISAIDDSGNESARSAVVQLAGASAAAITAWRFDPAYPNPSGGGATVTFPLVVPGNASGKATIDVLDAGGHLVRRIELSSLAAGPLAVTWDGRNDAGRIVAPGVYTAWLIAGDTRRNVKLVRLP